RRRRGGGPRGRPPGRGRTLPTGGQAGRRARWSRAQGGSRRRWAWAGVRDRRVGRADAGGVRTRAETVTGQGRTTIVRPAGGLAARPPSPDILVVAGDADRVPSRASGAAQSRKSRTSRLTSSGSCRF